MPSVPSNRDVSLNTPSHAPKALPPPLHAFYAGIISALRANFSQAPPYTVQRLAELLLEPRRHYRTLPAYLRALDRVVGVASPADAFPLPAAATGADGTHIGGPNFLGATTPAQAGDGAHGRDDFNGAALVRIPWVRDSPPGADLRTESTAVIDGPHGTGSVETVTVSVNGVGPGSARAAALAREQVTQQHAQRQAQEHDDEQGVRNGTTYTAAAEDGQATTAAERLSSPQGDEGDAASTPSTTVATPTSGHTSHDEEMLPDATAAASAEGAEEEEEQPHARGPEEIGMADTGPQVPGDTGPTHVFDVDAAMGRPGEGELVRMSDEEGEGCAESEEKKYAGKGGVVDGADVAQQPDGAGTVR